MISMRGSSPRWTYFAFLLLLLGSWRELQAQTTRLTFEELVSLSQNTPFTSTLQSKLDAVLQTPVVRNVAPQTNRVSATSKTIRIAEWNVERGENLESIQELLQSPESFIRAAARERRLSAAKMAELRRQAAQLKQSDVLLLNEVDIGVKRTGYRDVVDELARSLGMSSAYAVEFVEVDPLTDLGTEPAVLKTADLSSRMTEDLRPDDKRYQGIPVKAIISP